MRETGDWQTWLGFFANASSTSATQAAGSAKRLLELGLEDAARIEGLGRAAASALTLHRSLQRQPIASSMSLVKATKLTPATVNKALVHLLRLGIVTELTQKQRGRVFKYAGYTDILNEGMELPEGPAPA